MDFEPVRLGFIGCGSHAYRSHALVAAKMPELFTIVAAQDIKEEAMGRFAEIAPMAIKLKSSDELLAMPEVEAVVIATPDEFHLEQAQASVTLGKHVLCEKPLWVGTRMPVINGSALFEKAKNKNLIFTSCHPRRFEPVYRSYRDKLPSSSRNSERCSSS